MNVYDFDGTIYEGDSSVDFVLHCYRRQPRLMAYAPRQLLSALKHVIGSIDTTHTKEDFFSFLACAGRVDDLVQSFWAARGHRIKEWYLMQKKETDIVISASPEFLLQPICESLGIEPPIATRMNPRNGKISGINCKGAEKVQRFAEQFPSATIQEFYSDSLSDAPLAALAEHAFLVKQNKLKPWPERSRTTL